MSVLFVCKTFFLPRKFNCCPYCKVRVYPSKAQLQYYKLYSSPDRDQLLSLIDAANKQPDHSYRNACVDSLLLNYAQDKNKYYEALQKLMKVLGTEPGDDLENNVSLDYLAQFEEESASEYSDLES